MRILPTRPGADPTLSAYINRVRAIPRLSREEEHDLAVEAAKGNTDAAHRLVEANLRYAVAAALQYRRYGIPLWELIEEGNLGIMLATRKFDPERGVRFVTYAGYWIRAYVLDLVVRSKTMVGAGSGALRSKIFFRLRRERAQIAAREPDAERRIELLAERFNVGVEKARAMLVQVDSRDLSLDATVRPDGSLTILDTLRDESVDQETDLIAHEHQGRIESELSGALKNLDQRERYIVEQRILADDEVSLAELGRKLGISRERARQIEARAKRKLRKHLESFDTTQSEAA
jgi:RNA polymerase sigma-32 factor